jgi:hypothetical protein
MTGAPHNIKHHRLPRETTRKINVTDPDSRNQDDPGLAAGPAQFVQGESRRRAPKLDERGLDDGSSGRG